MKQELKVVEPKDFGIEKKQANELTKNLDLIIKERDILIDAYEDVITLEITEENLKTFRELRLQIRDNRTKGIEKWHKENKAYFLQGGKFIDTIKRKEVEVNSRMEDKLLKAEKHFENLELKRLRDLNLVRLELVKSYIEDVEGLNLSAMEEDVFKAYLETKKKKYNDRIEEEKKAEADRLAKIEAERLENERIRKENERLKKEAEKKEALRLKEEKERLKNERLESEKRKKEEEKRQAILDKERARQDAILKKEREDKEKLEAELKAKQEAEKEALRLKEEAEKLAKEEAEKLAKAPIKKQMLSWVNNFNIERSQIDNELSLEIIQKFNSFKKWCKSEIGKL